MGLEVFGLHGKISLITGASRGIGKVISRVFAEAGSDLVIAARSEDELQEVARDNETRGVKCLAVKADVGQAEDRERLLEKVRDTYGRLDVLVNNAGYYPRRRALEISQDYWRSIFQVNVESAFFLAQKSVELMQPQGGSIINFTSVASFSSFPQLSAYGSSKGAVTSLTKTLAHEWARFGIRVNAIGPSVIEVEHNKEFMASESHERDRILSKIPLRRIGKPEEIANATLFLASEASSFITGQVIWVDGGWQT